MKRPLLAFALTCATLGLGACGETAAPTPEAGAQAGIPGMTITNPRMVLAPVAGNPAAVYFDLAYDGDRNVALKGEGEVEGTKSAMFHDYGEYDFKVQMMDMLPVPLKNGDRIAFEPGGKHLMAMDPDASLQPGGTAKVTIMVSGGGRQTFDAPIRAAGEDR
ncbi:copper chaperone PCu(A)C [Tsuneonella amylolytica]|uniref:copper chaperone PCu(A)C n=1 Tax=Tsuneonella amylolytica TaxID=2338327 RepID=UPI000EAA517F|nr:copper chaperone PCu(A)C [Tsuneonella amylolytica]